MIEQLQQKLIEWVEKAGDLFSDQLPDFALQIVTYKMWSASIGFYFGLSFLIVSLIIMTFCLLCFFNEEKKEIKTKDGFETNIDCYFKGFLWMFFISLAIGFFTFSEYTVMKKCEVAPKIVILDYIRQL